MKSLEICKKAMPWSTAQCKIRLFGSGALLNVKCCCSVPKLLWKSHTSLN